MKLVEPGNGIQLDGVEVPREFYWVLESPTALAGMKYPRADFPWQRLNGAGLSKVVALHPGNYDPAPLEVLFEQALEDLVAGGPPRDEDSERQKVGAATNATVKAWHEGEGVVIHCMGGRGRTGTVLGCVLCELGFASSEVLSFLDSLHKVRGDPGWPEAPWQKEIVEAWNTDT